MDQRPSIVVSDTVESPDQPLSQFDKKPIMNLADIQIRKLSYTTRAELHKLLAATLFWNGHAASLLDMISHGNHSLGLVSLES